MVNFSKSCPSCPSLMWFIPVGSWHGFSIFHPQEANWVYQGYFDRVSSRKLGAYRFPKGKWVTKIGESTVWNEFIRLVLQFGVNVLGNNKPVWTSSGQLSLNLHRIASCKLGGSLLHSGQTGTHYQNLATSEVVYRQITLCNAVSEHLKCALYIQVQTLHISESEWGKKKHRKL